MPELLPPSPLANTRTLRMHLMGARAHMGKDLTRTADVLMKSDLCLLLFQLYCPTCYVFDN